MHCGVLHFCAMGLYDDILAYEPFNEQEAADKPVILRALRDDPACFERTAQAHMACSIWVVDPSFSQTLLVYHNIYDSWSWIGGHADGERNLAAVALRELEEETGVRDARLLPCGPGGIYSLEVLTVNGHEKRGKYVSSHLHLNVTYLAMADPTEPLRVKPDENSGVQWVALDQVIPLSTEPWIRERIYRKLIDKLQSLRQSKALWDKEARNEGTRDESTWSGVARNSVEQDGAVRYGAVQNEATQNVVAWREATRGEATWDEATRDSAARDEATRNSAAQDGAL